MEKAIYMFCLARAGLLPELGTDGLNDGAPLFTHNLENVTAVLCTVSLEDFCGPSAEAKLQDFSWLGPRAVRHGEVIDGAMQHSPVLPARFGTLFTSLDLLERLVERNLTEINGFLDFVTDRDEWAVKVVLSRGEVRDRLFDDRLAKQSEALASMPQGLRYFKERQIRTEVEKEVGSWVKGVLNGLAKELVSHAAEWRKRGLGIRAQEEGDSEKVANWAFLVERRAAQDFRNTVFRANSAHNSHGLFFDLSGPWPPYSFTPALKMADGL